MFIIINGIPEKLDEREKKKSIIKILGKTKLLMPNITFKPIPFALIHLALSQSSQ